MHGLDGVALGVLHGKNLQKNTLPVAYAQALGPLSLVFETQNRAISAGPKQGDVIPAFQRQRPGKHESTRCEQVLLSSGHNMPTSFAVSVSFANSISRDCPLAITLKTSHEFA